MDVRKWLNAAIENSTYDGYVNQLALRNELEPTITKLVEWNKRLETLISLIDRDEYAGTFRPEMDAVLHDEQFGAALAELEKP